MLTEDFLKGRRRRALSTDDLNALEAQLSEPRVVAARTRLAGIGEPVSVSTLLLKGFMLRYMDDHEGGRQIVSIQVPGDFVDLHGFPLGRLDHDVGTLCECEIATVPHAALTKLLDERPNLTKLLWLSTMLDAAMHREWIFRVGRLSAIGRIAHIFCEMEMRLRAVGRSDGSRFVLPANQTDIAESCGITSVHVNRVLAELRRRKLLSFQRGQVTILNHKALCDIGEFDPAYLYMDEM